MSRMLWVVVCLLALFALYLFLIAPARKTPDASALVGRLYAHRGLHDDAVPENSLAAFRRAVENGYGIELDTQHTKDGVLIVHHDPTLLRVCGVDRRILDVNYADLPPLPDGTRIPTFAEVLALVAGRVPLIVEVKYHGDILKNAEATLAALRAYNGPYCVESFHPLIVRYVRKHAPQVVRGQLAAGGRWQKGAEMGRFEHFAMKELLLNCLGRPHFVAYQCETDHNVGMGWMKRVFHPLLAGWTIRSQRELTYARREGYEMPIFERFIPNR